MNSNYLRNGLVDYERSLARSLVGQVLGTVLRLDRNKNLRYVNRRTQPITNERNKHVALFRINAR